MKKAIVMLAVVVLVAGTATAKPLFIMPEPHPGFTVHLDTGVQTLGPGNPLYTQPFTDGLFAPPDPWHWETETHNPGGVARTFIEGWFMPGFSCVAQVTLAPGGSLYTHFIIGESPEVGNWTAYMWNGLPYFLDMHMTVQEGYDPDDEPFQIEGTWDELPGAERKDCDIVHTPEPATMGLLALGGLAILRRRKK